MVRPELYNRILDLLRVCTPTIDTFAQTGENQVSRFWGPGGETEDAFSQPWNEDVLMWANPPYSRLDDCVRKILVDQPTMVLVVPDWRNTQWWKDLQPLITRAHYFPKGTAMFQLHGTPVHPVRWGVWAYLIDPHEKFSKVPGVLNDRVTSEVTSASNLRPATTLSRHADFDRAKHWKVLTWNVNGLRALNRKRWLRDLITEEEPDVLCLQEVKLKAKGHHKIATIPGYVMFTSLCPTRDGYSGTRTYVRPELVQHVQFGLPEGDTEEEEGRVITVELSNCYVVNVYVPYSGFRLQRHEYRTKTWDKLFHDHIIHIQAHKPVIIAGDMNVARLVIDKYSISSETEPIQGGVTPEERSNFEQLLHDAHIFDAFRHLYPTRTECYTFWELRGKKRDRNQGWRLDYFLMSDSLRDRLIDCYNLTHIQGSDHCPVGLWMSKIPRG